MFLCLLGLSYVFGVNELKIKTEDLKIKTED